MQAQPAHPRRKDTFDLRDQIHPDDTRHAHQQYEGEHSVMEDSSDAEGEDMGQDSMDIIDHGYGAERDHDIDADDHESDDAIGDYMSDSSSSLSIPNESIDFDLVYSLTNFAATVEGQASVVKGDSLFLMDDSNSYWWLVRVLKTQEVGYIPAENIETPFERLARLNRHRNVDLASATLAEKSSLNPAAAKSSRNKNRVHITAPADSSNGEKRAVAFRPSSSVFRYPPAVWNEEDEDADEEWDEDDIEIEDALVKDETMDDDMNRDGDIVQVDIGDDGGNGREQSQDVQMVWDEDGRQADAPTLLQSGVNDPIVADRQVQQQQNLDLAQQQQQSQLRDQTSRERLVVQQEQQGQSQQTGRSSTSPLLDPADATETRRLVITPSVARDEPAEQQVAPLQQQKKPGPLLPSAIIEKRQQELEQERKRTREEIEAAEEASRKRAAKGRELGLGAPPVQAQVQQKELTRSASQETRSSTGSSANSGGKLRKDRGDKDRDAEESEKENGKDKKKKAGVFAGLFGRRKDKDKGSKASIENIGAAATDSRVRGSEDSGVSSAQSHGHSSLANYSPETSRGSHSPAPSGRPQLQQRSVPAQQQQQQPQQGSSPPQAASPPQSPPQQPISLLRERDQQQQALYQQYLKRSPSSPPEQPSYATQSASLVMPSQGSGSLSSSPNSSGFGLGLAPANPMFRTQGGRPGSLILSSAPGMDGQSGIGVPELSVIRVFAGRGLQSDATFKTVLLNSSTTASDLVRQAMQRFRLAAGEDAGDYYLTVKQVEGSSLQLNPDEKPLGVFEQLVEEAMELPKVKRSSMGSISSIASNLSAHPAIRKLPMNDFTDDSAVKFYLNRRSSGGDNSPTYGDEDTLTNDSTLSADSDASGVKVRGQFLSVSTSLASSVSPERFSSPSVRFALQLVIYPDELPDNMVFDPHTEAIVFKETLRDRSQSSATVNPGVSQSQRKKFFNFPKNITVAEVIELGLERFGILEGVVDGGDEVEDKLTKRRSISRVRYILTVQGDGQERELQPSSKVVDAFARPPVFRRSGELKRRSVDSAQLLLGTMDDVQSDDPVFVLRRAVAYRSTSSRHHRLSAPLDEVALSHLHRDSSASDSSSSPAIQDESKSRQPSRQEIIAAQRAASRANQKAMLSTQANSQRGVDVVLPDKGMLRSQRHDTDSRMRYSYVQPDGESYDISDIVEEEFKASESMRSVTTPTGSSKDLLSGVMNGAQPNALISRVLNKINGKNGSVSQSSSSSTVTSSMYSDDERSDTMDSRAATPTASTIAALRSMTPTTAKPTEMSSRSRSVTPLASAPPSNTSHRQYQPSIESIMSDISDYRTAASGTPLAMTSIHTVRSPSPLQPKRLRIPKDEFGLTEMLAIINSKASLGKQPPPPQPDEVDRLLFGTELDAESIHPQIRDVYAGTFKKMKELDAELDSLLQKTMHLF
ncbi:hypothetical protein M0805_003589 [Coniferiporia weirii]|nr:hypothetical protein M0805_003589 [Coniferiporia weirii]